MPTGYGIFPHRLDLPPCIEHLRGLTIWNASCPCFTELGDNYEVKNSFYDKNRFNMLDDGDSVGERGCAGEQRAAGDRSVASRR
jgi:hypothetical protein